MGFDYSNHHVFVGDANAADVRDAVVDCVRGIPMTRSSNDDANRSIVVGPSERWIFVGDSAGSTEEADPKAFDALAIDLSSIAPTIDVKVSDTAIVHIFLYADGQLIDKFGNGSFPWFRFKTNEESTHYRGDVEKWSLLLHAPADATALRQTWSQDGNADSIVRESARLFGIHPELIQVGYSIFDEQIEIKYDDWLDDGIFELGLFDEFHFIRTPEAK